MSCAKSSITGIVRSARKIPPIPSVSAMVCRSPYFFGISKSITVEGSYPPTWIAFTTKSASFSAFFRFATPRYVLIFARFALMFLFRQSSTVSDSFRRSASMSYNAISESFSASRHMQSPSTFFAKIVLPAPMNVIFGIFSSYLLSGCHIHLLPRNVRIAPSTRLSTALISTR